MPIDPELLPSLADARPEAVAPGRARPQTIPNLGHALLFLVLVVLAGLILGFLLSIALLHLPRSFHPSANALQTDARAVIPLEVAIYALAALLAWTIFPRLWRQPFLASLRWNLPALRRGWLLLAGVGAALSVGVQVLSNYLPIPKSLPIDQFFTNPVGVWIVAIFGVTVAPFFEELAFRGFLLPALASAWDWIMDRAAAPPDWPAFATEPPSPGIPAELEQALPSKPMAQGDHSGSQQGAGMEQERLALPQPGRISALRPSGPAGDPRWSTPALIFATVLTSVAFALLHSEQLAHAWAPLSVLFTVSVVLCVVRLRAHSLAASAFVHACYNGTIFLLLFVTTSGFRHLEKLGG